MEEEIHEPLAKRQKIEEEGEIEGTRERPRVVLTEAQKMHMLEEARGVGFWGFLELYHELRVQDLLQVFDEEIPDGGDMECLEYLHTIMLEKAGPRRRLSDVSSVEDVVRLLEECSNIVVLTGAGCSVSCGIPDFRSPNGIYSRLSEFELEDPQQMFDLQYFKVRPEAFYSFAKEIYPSNFRPSASHKFIRLLEQKGKLLRNYTQNIDTLERSADIERVVQCHGSFATATCIVCGYRANGDSIEPNIMAQQVPSCPVCHEDNEGIMKPDIVFFGENLPAEFDAVFAEDKKKADLLIVIGSSLKVSPVAQVKDRLPHDVPQILINLEALPHMRRFDVQLLGFCDTIVAELCKRLDWQLDHPTIPTLPKLPLETRRLNLRNAYRDGSEPNRFIFEGGVDHEAPFEDCASSLVSTDCSSIATLSDDEEDDVLEEGDAVFHHLNAIAQKEQSERVSKLFDSSSHSEPTSTSEP